MRVEGSRLPASCVRQLPNALTTVRLAAVPLFAALLLSANGAPAPMAAAVFAFAALTDFLDGEFSRRLHAQSRYGRVLDPIADRLLIDVAAILLWYEGRFPWFWSRSCWSAMYFCSVPLWSAPGAAMESGLASLARPARW